MSLETLFTPFHLKTLTMKNRVVMAPMTRSFSPDGIPTPAVADYYERRAKGQVGLIITEGTVIERPASKNDKDIPNFYGHALEQWKPVVDRVHAAGGKIAPQIWHVGNVKARGGYDPLPKDSPSGYHSAEKQSSEPMTETAIADTIAAFGRAAASAKALGFDALELHGAHGYLIDQFFWKGLNKRTDQWGGESIGARTRFASEVIKACRAAVGPDFPIIIRVSQWKQQDYDAKIANTPDEMVEWLKPLVDAGADMLHCSQRRLWEPEFTGSDLNFAGWAKKLMGVPTISVGSVGLSGEFIAAFGGEGSQPTSIDQVLRRLDAKEFDLVAVGRALLSDPDWVVKIKEGRVSELKAFERKDMMTLF